MEEETIEVEGVGSRGQRIIKRRLLCEVIEPRAEEILNFINNEIQKSQLSGLLGAGVVLTGGGAQLDGLIEMAEFVFDLPVRRGEPQDIGGLVDVVEAPAYATSVGLIQLALEQIKGGETKPGRTKSFFGGWGDKIKSLLDQSF